MQTRHFETPCFSCSEHQKFDQTHLYDDSSRLCNFVINPTFEVPALTGYVIYPSDGSCRGDEFGEFKAIRKKQSEYEDKAEFDFWSWESSSIPWSPSIPKEIKYNPKTGAKTCIPGDDQSYCKDGRW